MAAVLVATGLWVQAGLTKAAATVTQGQAISIAFAARRVLRATNELDSQVLKEVVDELGGQGLRFVEVTTRDGRLVASGGSGATGVTWPAAHSLGPSAAISFGPGGYAARITVTPPDPPAGSPPPPPPPRPSADHPDHPLHGKQLLFEVDSVAAHALLWRARVTSTVSLLAALILFGLAALFLRLVRHAEKVSAQLEHDRQLKALGQMSAVLGHEIKNPLASLKGHAQLLLEKLSPEHPGRRGAEVVLRETIRLEELSRHVLEFARSGAINCEAADPRAVARAAIDSVGSGDVRFHVESSPAVWPLDRVRMEEVLVNLLRNAREASPAGQPVEVTLEAPGERSLAIEVRDHGPGIEPGEEERVFEPFYTRRAKGTGLGLALARRIVEGHGGTITAHNHPDGGAVFSVRLPPSARGV
jgi:two-component system sensor histidine kinase HydH